MKADLSKYSQFVEGVTSDTSKYTDNLVDRITELAASEVPLNVPLLITAAIGMPDEAGEFSGLVKKVVFHGKPYTEEIREHMSKELGDVAWYWVNACRAIGVDPNQVLADNVDKLKSRYPGGVFSVDASENRKEGDI